MKNIECLHCDHMWQTDEGHCVCPKCAAIVQRAVGEIFNMSGIAVMVVPSTASCTGCVFSHADAYDEHVCTKIVEEVGECSAYSRTDDNYVHFVPLEDL